MTGAVAPVRQRQIDINADGVDVGVRPQGIEVEIHVAGAVIGAVAVIFGPVGGIGDPGARPQNGFDIGGERLKRNHGGIGRRRRANLRQAAQLRADGKTIHPARRGAKMGIVEHHAAITPVRRRAGKTDRGPRNRKVGNRRRAEKRRNLARCGGGAVRRAWLAGGRMTGNAAAPGIGPLLRPAIRVGQPVGIGDIHQQEGVEDHLQPARLELGNGGDDGVVRRRAAKGRAARCVLGHLLGPGAGNPVHRPVLGQHGFGGKLDLGLDQAGPSPKITAEPRCDQRDGAAIGGGGGQVIKGHHKVGLAGGIVQVFGHIALGGGPHRNLGAIDELARAGDQRHRAELAFQLAIDQRLDDLRRDLRDTIAEGADIEVFEDQVTEPAIGRHIAAALDGFDKAVGILRLRAGIEPGGEPGQIEGLAVGPDPAQRRRLALGKSNGKRHVIAIARRGAGDRRGRVAAAALAATTAAGRGGG